MLPPGIYLWESGYEDIVAPFFSPELSNASQSWKADFEDYNTSDVTIEIENVGHFIKSERSSEATIVVVNSCVSTMEAARILAQNNVLGEWGAVLAVTQSGGRGQLRRPWVSPSGNMHVSVVLPASSQHLSWSESYVRLLPLLAGYVFGEAFEEVGAKVQLKWPNDFLQNDRKVGGMLIEERNELVILGLGVNLAESPSDEKMREDRSVPAAILKTKKEYTGPVSLWETLVNRGKSVYVVVLDELEPSEFLTAITNRLAWLGHRVRIHERESDVYYAEIVGVSPLGGLVIRRDGRESVLFSGSIAPL